MIRWLTKSRACLWLKKCVTSFYNLGTILAYRIESGHCFIMASSLTFSSIFAIVPVLAVTFGIAKGFGLDQVLEQRLLAEFQDQQEVFKHLIDFGYTLLNETKSGLIAGIGVAILLFTVMRLIATIEYALNDMWGLRSSRPLSRKMSDYLAFILICPLIFIIASSITVFITTTLESFESQSRVAMQMQPLFLATVKFLPYLMIAGIFTFLYIVIPNTNVKIVSALLGGLLAGVAYQLLQAFYISLQIQLSNYGAIYGSFAALPLFFLWLYLSWMIFLIGAEIVVFHQERLSNPTMFFPLRSLTFHENFLMALALTKAAVNAYVGQKPPPTVNELASLLFMPTHLVSALIDQLADAKLLIKTDGESEVGIVPAINPETIRIFDVAAALVGPNLIPFDQSPLLSPFNTPLTALREDILASPNNVRLAK